MAERYNRLYNRVADNPIWTQLSPAVFKVFCGCLMRANYKDSKWYDGAKEILVKRGSFVTSRERLAEFCRVTPQQARDALAHMKKLEIITCVGTSKYTVVSFCHYEQYNGFTAQEEPAEEPAKDPSENQERTKSEPRENQVGTTVVTESEIAAVVAKHENLKREPSAMDHRIRETAEELSSEHPNQDRTLRPEDADRAIRLILKTVPAIERVLVLDSILRRHRGRRDRCRLDLQYCPKLKKWLHPRDGEWKIEPNMQQDLVVANGAQGGSQMTFAERNEEIRNRKFMQRMAEDLAGNG